MGRFARVERDEGRLHRALHLIGPWPLRPAPLTAFLAIFMMVWVGSYFANTGFPIPADGWLRLALAVPSAILIGLVLWGLRRLLGTRLLHLPWYLAAIAAAAVLGGIFRVATGQLATESFPSPGAAVIFSSTRLFVFLLVAQAIIGLITERLEGEIERANTALDDSRRLQQRLIEADERLRTQVATMLHDRVQAGLIAACLELTDAIRPGGVPDPGPAVREVVMRLETMRDIDVRQAAHRLSPDLASLDLRTALEDLAAQYLPGMRTTVEMDDDFALVAERAHLPVLLAAYRVAEQALLNAAIHGRARHCRIDARFTAGALELRIVDDGLGPAPSNQPGLGTFVTDTWTGILGGSWELRPGQFGGAELTACLPLSGPTHAEIDRALTGPLR